MRIWLANSKNRLKSRLPLAVSFAQSLIWDWSFFENEKREFSPVEFLRAKRQFFLRSDLAHRLMSLKPHQSLSFQRGLKAVSTLQSTW